LKIEEWNGHEIRFVWHDGEWWAVAKDVAKALGYVVHIGDNRYITVDELKAQAGIQTVEDLAKKGEFITEEVKAAAGYAFVLTSKNRLLLVSNWMDEDDNVVIPNMVREVADLLDDVKMGEVFKKETTDFLKRMDAIFHSNESKVISRLKKAVSYVEPPPPPPTKSPEPEREVGYVYLLRADNGLIKIGKTKSLKNRLDHFTVKLPYELHLIGVVKSERYGEIERELHDRFHNKRKRGEWFDLSEKDIEAIKEKYGLISLEEGGFRS